MFSKIFITLALALLLAIISTAPSAIATGPAAVNLHTAANYAILAKSGVSTVNPSAITGAVAVSPIAATGLTGFSLTLDSSGTFSTSAQVTGRLFAASYSALIPSALTVAVGDMGTAFTGATGRVDPDFTNLASVCFSWVTKISLPNFKRSGFPKLSSFCT